MASVIEPHIRLADTERDIALVRIEVEGRRDGNYELRILNVLDYRDLKTGLTAMSRTVGFTAIIGAILLLSGKINKRGLLSPIRDIPYELFVDELKKRNIHVYEKSM